MELEQRHLWDVILDAKTSEKESLDTFMFRFVETYDPHHETPLEAAITRAERTEGMPGRAFGYKEYLDDLNTLYVNRRLIVIPKSRQLRITWWATAAFVWDSIRHSSRFTTLKSIDRKHSGLGKLNLLWRVQFIVEHLPKCVRPRIVVRRKDMEIELPDSDSHFFASSQEGDVTRSYTPTGCLDDELAKQPYGEAGYHSIAPGLGGVGRYIALSTYTGPGDFFCRMVDDKFEL